MAKLARSLAPILGLACSAMLIVAAQAALELADGKDALAANMEAGHEHHGDNCPTAVSQKVAQSQGNEPGKPRNRRQIPYPDLAPPQQAPAGLNSNPFGQLGELSAQVDRLQAPLKMITGLWNGGKQQQQQPPATFEQTIPAAINNAAGSQQSGLPSASQFMSSLTELVRSSRDNGSNLAQSAQQGAQQTGQQATAAAQSAQGGIAAALAEIGQGLQRIASNNPSLVPDVRNLYSSVSTKLSTASQSVGQAVQPTSSNIVPAKSSEQLADNLAKLTFPGLQTPTA